MRYRLRYARRRRTRPDCAAASRARLRGVCHDQDDLSELDWDHDFRSVDHNADRLQGQTFTTGTSADGDVLLLLSGGGTIELNGVAPANLPSGFVL